MKFVKHLSYLFLFSLGILLHTSFIPNDTFNILLLIILIINLFYKWETAIIYSMFLGFIADIYNNYYFGISPICFMLTIIITSFIIQKRIHGNSSWLKLLLIFLSTILYFIILFIIEVFFSYLSFTEKLPYLSITVIAWQLCINIGTMFVILWWRKIIAKKFIYEQK